MSAAEFLRKHGWRQRGSGWEHKTWPDVVCDTECALLQQGQWLDQQLERIRSSNRPG